MFSRLKGIVQENSVEETDAGTDHLVTLQSRFSKQFLKQLSNKYKWIIDPFHTDLLQNCDLILEE
jgi:hypothetical protein